MHRVDDGFNEVGELLVPAAERRPGEVEAVAGVDALEAMERQRVLPAVDDSHGEHAGPGEAAVDRTLRCLGHHDARLKAAWPGARRPPAVVSPVRACRDRGDIEQQGNLEQRISHRSDCAR